MAKYGLLIDLDRCVGCKTHEIVCKKEGNEVVRQPLITISRTTDEGKKVMQYLPFVQAECSKSKSCVKRVGHGQKPRCIAACMAQARRFGEVEELLEYIRTKNMPHAYLMPF